MPRVYLTSAQRKDAREQLQRERAIRIINTACAARDENRQSLAKKTGIDYQVFNRRMRGESDFRLLELVRIADALCLDDLTRASILGSKKKCRFEPGYEEAIANDEQKGKA